MLFPEGLISVLVEPVTICVEPEVRSKFISNFKRNFMVLKRVVTVLNRHHPTGK